MPWDWLLSRPWGCLSSGRFHHSAASLDQGAHTAHTLLAVGSQGYGEGSPGHWTVGTGTCLAPVELHSTAALLCASLMQCPSGGWHGRCHSASLGKFVGV